MYDHDRQTFMRVFQGAPLPVLWAGWRSDTHTLSRQGWEILAHEEADPCRNMINIRLGLRSKDARMAISGVASFPQAYLYERHSHGTPFFLEEIMHRGFHMQTYHAHDTIRVHGQAGLQYAAGLTGELESMAKMRPIDVYEPHDINLQSVWREIRMGELKLFKDKPAMDSKEIYIPMNSVDDCLNRILELQYPEQEEIKKGLIMPEKKPLIQAQIFTLAA